MGDYDRRAQYVLKTTVLSKEWCVLLSCGHRVDLPRRATDDPDKLTFGCNKCLVGDLPDWTPHEGMWPELWDLLDGESVVVWRKVTGWVREGGEWKYVDGWE